MLVSFLKDYISQLETEEGVKIHKNTNESDITLPYGLYKKRTSQMYLHINILAKSKLGISKDTTEWNREDIEKVNSEISKDPEKIKELALEFYEQYMKEAHLNLYPLECRALIFSLYVNSPYYCIKAVQRSIINMVLSKRIKLTMQEISIEDGYWGSKTANAISYIRSFKSIDYHYYFEEAIINNMEDIYEEIVEDDQKQEINLKGWKNRVRKFQKIK